MHAWVWDDQAILLLKTLIPRKGELLRSASSKQGEYLQKKLRECLLILTKQFEYFQKFKGLFSNFY